MSPLTQAVADEYGAGRGGTNVIRMWCASGGLGALVLSGTIAHINGRPGISRDRTIAGRRLPISGGWNPCERSTRTMVPSAGWVVSTYPSFSHQKPAFSQSV